jgi:methionyl-tRNA synthetase
VKPFYLTTPLYYVNSKPHLGHTYTTVIADCLARYKKMQGFEVCFLTGTDEHGQNIERAAAAKGITPKELADTVAEEYQKLWSQYGIEYDQFIRTTENRHRIGAGEIFRRAVEKGTIYKGEYSGWYCIHCNLFAPESETRPNCEVCSRPTERITEESYFFRLSEFQKRLLDHYEKYPGFVVPTSRFNEVISFVRGGLKDLSISRTSVKWGIPVPGDDRHVIYVCFDALVGYLTGIGFGNPSGAESFQKYWPAQVQLVGKDILRFHAVYWPAFLMAADLDLPKQIFAHGWWLKDETKMSKSRGNVIDPILLKEHLGSDAVRYFLLREVPFGLDGNFSYEALVQRVNSDLANDFGNLVSRTLTLISKNFSNRIPYPSAVEAHTRLDREIEQAALVSIKGYQAQMDQLAFSKALEAVWELLAKANKYINESAPWALTDDPSQRPRLATVLYTSTEVIRIATVLLAPVLPDSCESVWKQLGMSTELKACRIDELKWGGLPVGTSIGEISPVFPRLDKKVILEKLFESKSESGVATAPAESGEKDKDSTVENTTVPLPAGGMAEDSPTDKITIDDFAKIDLRVGQILSAERIQGADKLLTLQVDLGNETRQVLAGIAKYYAPESLLGKKIIIVSNLQPRKMRGLESQGMLLAASVGAEDKPVLATFLEDVPNGAKLR